MDQLNPYEAPQTLVTSQAVPLDDDREVGPEIFQVIRGARACFWSLVIYVGAMLVLYAITLMLPPDIVGYISYLKLLVFIVAILFHGKGLLLLLKVHPLSQARRLLFVSWICFLLFIFAYVLHLGAMFYGRSEGYAPWEHCLNQLLNTAGTIALLLGLKRIGNYYLDEKIARKAKVAAILLGGMHALSLIAWGCMLIPAVGAKFLAMERTDLMKFLSLGLFSMVIMGVGYYLQALRLIIKLEAKIEYEPTELTNSP